MKLKKLIFGALLDFFEIVFIASAVFAVVYVFLGQVLDVSGNSMNPTFTNGEKIVAEKISIKFEPPTRGEVVILRYPANPTDLLIKRIVGLPGETLKIQNGLVYVNGSILNESYLISKVVTVGQQTISEGLSYQIPENSYVVMGDNRGESSDSRSFGAISKNLIVGREFLVIYPINKIRFL